VAQRLVAGRRAVVVLTRFVTVESTGSTNADLLAAARDGAEEGLWLRAECQTAGRGRSGRAWESSRGNLYASTLVRLRPNDPPAPTLALVSAVALYATVSALLPTPALRLKWPNDLLLDGAKLAGILLERADDGVVAGFGVNVAHHPEGLDRPVTSLFAQGLHVTAATFNERLAERFAAWLATWRHEGLAPVISAWLAAGHLVGTELSARLPDGTAFNGSFAGLDASGALLLRLASGETRAIHAGDVFLI
jgi:BirA family transcriptional regulator, biotin operon repressor / biotin---[acetyl-CoA-carboxylase] ligase